MYDFIHGCCNAVISRLSRLKAPETQAEGLTAFVASESLHGAAAVGEDRRFVSMSKQSKMFFFLTHLSCWFGSMQVSTASLRLQTPWLQAKRGAEGLRCKDVTRPAGVWQAVGILATGAATWGYRWVRCWPDTSSISAAASHRSLALTSSWGNRETEAGFGRGERGRRGKAGKDTRRREVKRTRDNQEKKKGGK